MSARHEKCAAGDLRGFGLHLRFGTIDAFESVGRGAAETFLRAFPKGEAWCIPDETGQVSEPMDPVPWLSKVLQDARSNPRELVGALKRVAGDDAVTVFGRPVGTGGDVVFQMTLSQSGPEPHDEDSMAAILRSVVPDSESRDVAALFSASMVTNPAEDFPAKTFALSYHNPDDALGTFGLNFMANPIRSGDQFTLSDMRNQLDRAALTSGWVSRLRSFFVGKAR